MSADGEDQQKEIAWMMLQILGITKTEIAEGLGWPFTGEGDSLSELLGYRNRVKLWRRKIRIAEGINNTHD